MEIDVQSEGPTAMADEDACRAVGEDLQQAYPGYPWMVGCDHTAGRLVIDIALKKPFGLENYAYALHLATVFGPGGQARVRRAGGELLERFGLRRGHAAPDHRQEAASNGLDIHEALYPKKGHTT